MTWTPAALDPTTVRARVTMLAMLTAACVPSWWLFLAPTMPLWLVAVALPLAGGAAWVVRRTITRRARDTMDVFRTIGSWMPFTIPSALLVAWVTIDDGSSWEVAGIGCGILLGSHGGWALALLSARVRDAMEAPSHRTSARAAIVCGRWLAVMHGIMAFVASIVVHDGTVIALALALAAPPFALLVAGWAALGRRRRFIERVRNRELPEWTLVPEQTLTRELRVELLPWSEEHSGMVLARVKASGHGYRESRELEPFALV